MNRTENEWGAISFLDNFKAQPAQSGCHAQYHEPYGERVEYDQLSRRSQGSASLLLSQPYADIKSLREQLVTCYHLGEQDVSGKPWREERCRRETLYLI